MNGEEKLAIGRLEGSLSALDKRMERAEACRLEHQRAIISRLTKLEESNHFNKGRMSWIGGMFSVVLLAISAAAGALINNVMES